MDLRSGMPAQGQGRWVDIAVRVITLERVLVGREKEKIDDVCASGSCLFTIGSCLEGVEKKVCLSFWPADSAVPVGGPCGAPFPIHLSHPLLLIPLSPQPPPKDIWRARPDQVGRGLSRWRG